MRIMRRIAVSLHARIAVLAALLAAALLDLSGSALAAPAYRHLTLYGWNVEVDERLYSEQPAAINTALRLTGIQLAEIVRALPASALRELRQVTLWFSPPYAGFAPGGAYHPSRAWLEQNGRDPRMAKSVEFTNVAIFEQETTRMPWFVFHELAHAYHDRVLGYDNPEVEADYARARLSGRYNTVERRNGRGHANTPSTVSYAMENRYEFFAESSEALFGFNDFYPYNREQLRRFDPDTYRLLMRLWGVTPTP